MIAQAFKLFGIALVLATLCASLWLNWKTVEYVKYLRGAQIYLFLDRATGNVAVQLPYSDEKAQFEGVCRPEQSL